MIKTSKRVGVLVVLATVAILMGMTFSADGQDKKASGLKTPIPGMIFEVYKDKGGDFRYRMVDDAGTNLGGASKGYGKKEDVLKVVNAIKKDAATAKIDDQTTKK
jgi:uncharacterized protein